MKIISLNVNGLRSAIRKGLITWLVEQKADVICLQEIKVTPEEIPAEKALLSHYHAYFYPAQKKGYSGVAVYSLRKPDQVHYGLGWEPCDEEGRYLQLDFADLSIASIYLPSGSAGPHRQEKKFLFMDKFLNNLKIMKKTGRDFILCGDWNIVRSEYDIKNWKSNQKNSGCLPEERDWMNQLCQKEGFIDGFRHLYPEKIQYSWWSQRGQAYANDVGWRIDYQIITPAIAAQLRSMEILRLPKFSDHAPVIGIYERDV